MKKNAWSFLGFLIIFFIFSAVVEAQVSSSAFDPNCYQPRLGVASEIDSIYGSKDHQYLGASMIAFPPSVDFPAGRIGIANLPDNPLFLSFGPKSPVFDLHNLNSKVKKSNLGQNTNGKFGHFHDSKHMDLFVSEERRIYWADENGDFDSAKYTVLASSKKGDVGESYGSHFYITSLLSDTVVDIVSFVTINDTPDVVNRKAYALLFAGGEHLFKNGKISHEDSSGFIETHGMPVKALYMQFLQGDFRGTNREDLILTGDSGNWFFYKNDPPFVMAKFINAIFQDTFMTVRENSDMIESSYAASILSDANAFQILPHSSGDNAQDLIIGVRDHKSPDGRKFIYEIFRGNPLFGSQRLVISRDAELIFHTPWYYDSQFDQMTLGHFIDCGDMTGQGEHVLFCPCSVPGYSSQFFYVTGKAIDDKADLYYGYSTQGYAWNPIPFDADGDKYNDVLLSDASYATEQDVDNNKSSVGTIHLVHGSNKIPVRLNPKYSVEERKEVDKAPWHILAHPNPCDETTVLTFDNCTTSRMQVDIVSTTGKVVSHDETPAVDGLQQFTVDLSTLPAGMYIIRLTCPAQGWTGSVNVVKTGAVKEPWSSNLKGMVGR